MTIRIGDKVVTYTRLLAIYSYGIYRYKDIMIDLIARNKGYSKYMSSTGRNYPFICPRRDIAFESFKNGDEIHCLLKERNLTMI